ncbi:MAG: YetF domain-containing protein, partial [Hyphomicrobium sp.]
MLDHLTISIIRHRRTYRNFHHQISGFTNAADSQISINRAMCGLLGAYRKEMITEEELKSQLREQGVENYGDIKLATLEGDGRL